MGESQIIDWVAVKKHMQQIFLDDPDRFMDSAGEPNMTLLAEETAFDLMLEDELDDETSQIWDLAIEVSENGN